MTNIAYKTLTPIEFGKLCADFMEMKYGKTRFFDKETHTWTHTTHSLQNFYTNWEWLKSVLEKIGSLNEEDFSPETAHAFEDILDLSMFSVKDRVRQRVYMFIYCYNKQKQIK